MWIAALGAAVVTGLVALLRSRRGTGGAARRRHAPGLS
jgi:hypothetical protein